MENIWIELYSKFWLTINIINKQIGILKQVSAYDGHPLKLERQNLYTNKSLEYLMKFEGTCIDI